MTEEIALHVRVQGAELRIELRIELRDRSANLIASGLSDLKALDAAIGRWRSRDQDPLDGSDLQALGRSLSGLLVPDSVREAIQTAASKSRGLDKSLRIHLESSDPLLEDVPFELLWLDRVRDTDPLDGYLARQPALNIVRHVGGARRPGPPTPHPIRILVVVADPGSIRFPKLTWVQAEIRAIASAFKRAGAGLATLKVLPDTVPGTLERNIKEFKPDVLHFCGHGEIRPTGGVLILQGADSRSETAVGAGDLLPWIKAGAVRLVVLGACNTFGSSRGVAETLAARSGVSVLALQGKGQDGIQPQLARTFYGSLVDGSSLEDATAEVRHALAGAGDAWMLPVLVSCEPELRLFPANTLTTVEALSNLPPNPSPFVGRQLELETIVGRIRRSRLVSLVGAGGIGKSRLGIKAAEQVQGEFSDGAWFVSCETCRTKEDLYGAIVGAMSLLPGRRSVLQTALEELRERHSLLVLDCFEHLDASDALSNLLDLQSISVLATSRKRLGLPEEDAVEVQPLGTGEGDDQRADVSLFCLTAGLNYQSLDLAMQSTIVSICDLLEGVPLAIVLCAARAKLLDLDLLHSMLKESLLRTLDGPDGAMSLAVQRTLNLVPFEDQRLLWKLSVFSGSFTWDDVIAVSQENRFDLLDSLTRLGELCLLQSVGSGDAKRFQLLDSVREFVLSNQEEGSHTYDRLAARNRHASHFCSQAEAVLRLMDEGRWGDATALLWPNLGNFRAALRFLVENGRQEQVAKLVEALARVTMESGLWSDFEALLVAGRRAADELNKDLLTVKLLGLEGALALRSGDIPRGRARWDERLALCERIGDERGRADTLLDLAALALDNADQVECRRYLDIAEPVVKVLSRADLLGQWAMLRAVNAYESDRLEEARAWVAEAEEYSRQAVDQDTRLFLLMNLAILWRRWGEIQRAKEACFSVLKTATVGDRRVYVGIPLCELATILEGEGQVSAAICAAYASTQVYAELGSRRRPQAEALLEGILSRHDDHPAIADYRTRSWRGHVNDLLKLAD
jgi:predicted ATPase